MPTIKKIFGITFLLAIALAVIAGSYYRILEKYELEALDFRFQLRPGIKTTDKVALIEISDDTIKKIGRFPFERRYHAILVKALSDAGARAIIFDLFFSEPQDSDKEFEDAIKEAGNVYLPFVFEIDSAKIGELPRSSSYAAKELDAFYAAAKAAGHINVIPDIDGKFRRVPVYIKYGNSTYPYISFLAACDYLGIPQKDIRIVPGKEISCGPNINIPLDDKSNMIVNFAGKWVHTYRHYSYADVLQSYIARVTGSSPNMDLAALKDKICVIGLTAVGTIDLHPNPFETLYPAVGMHAEVINSLLNRNFITRISPQANLLIFLLLSFLISLVSFRMRPMRGLVVLVATIFIFALLCVLLFNIRGLWIDMIYPVFAVTLVYLSCTLYKYIKEWTRGLVFENELGIAKKIQESFLSKTIPLVEGLDLSATMFMARQVGGDLYDFIKFDDTTLGVMIGDVSGKGIPASLFMAMSMGAFKSFVITEGKTEDVLSNLNSKLTKESSSNLFITVFYAVFDTKKKTVSYSNGGHMPTLKVTRGEDAQFLDVEDGMPLGLIENNYSSRKINYKEGDVFIFYTDGVTEAMNSKHQMYGSQRLVAVAEKNKHLPVAKLLEAIDKDIKKFEPRSRQHDDMTIIVVKAT